MTEPSTQSALPAGYRLHWYELGEVLGQGGFGITYLAEDLNLKRQVALKEYFPAEYCRREGDRVVPFEGAKRETFDWGLRRFVDEARTLSQFEHPNIVKVHAVFEENGTGYMVMSYERGRSLQDLLEEGASLDEATLLGIVRPLLEGLAIVHDHKFIHRDIKPDNILIRADRTPALLDFGSARRALPGEDNALTVVVTPGYAPVEQYYSQADEQGPWTDIYGLGATLYRAVSGKPLTNAVERSKSQLGQVQETHQGELALEQANYSQPFLRAIAHAIQFRPEDRPQSARDWLAELPEAAAPRRTVVLDDQASIAPKEPERGASAVKIGAGAIAGLLLMAGAYVFFSAEEAPTEAPQQLATPATEPESDGADPRQERAEDPTADSVGVEAADSPDAGPITEPPIDVAAQDDLTDRAAAPAELQPEPPDAAEAAAREEQRKLDEARAALAAEQEAFERRKRLEQERSEAAAEAAAAAEEAAAKEEAERQRTERLIAASQKEFDARNAEKADELGFRELPVTVDLASVATRQVQIAVYPEVDDWQSTGVTITRGASYAITAPGTWRMGPGCKITDATGEGMYGLLCLNLGGQPVQKRAHGALVGKIGQDELGFYVGPEFTFTAPRDGTLYLRSNDGSLAIGDNSGPLEVSIRQVEPPAND